VEGVLLCDFWWWLGLMCLEFRFMVLVGFGKGLRICGI
jgi:hypothetical protein